MSTTPKIETPTSLDQIPGGAVPQGESQEEAMAGLFDALAAEPEFADNDDAGEPTPDEGDLGEDGESDEDDDLEDESDESDEDEEGDDLDDDSDDESEDGEEGDEDGEDLYEVTLPGGEKKEVTLEELTAGYSRTEDYTRKRQRDAAEHTQALTEVRGIRDQYKDRLGKLEETLTQLGPKAPDAALRKSNPGEYAAQVAEFNAFQTTLSQVGEAKEAITAEEAAEIAESQRAFVNAEWAKVVQAVPEWADQQAAISGLTALRDHAVGLGFTNDELDGLADSRLLLLLKENQELTQKRSKGKKKVETKRKTSKRLRPGSAKRTPASRRSKGRKAQQSADKLAHQSGSVKDAARAIEMLLGDDE